MNLVELLVIKDCFQITGRGVVLSPDFSVPKAGWKDRTAKVFIAVPNCEASEATAYFDLTRFSFRDPSVPLDKRVRVVVVITDRTKEALPIGSQILVSPEIRDLLLPPQTPNKAPEPTPVSVTPRAIERDSK